MSRPPRPVDPGPRSNIDRLASWGEQNIWGERQPEWYEEPGVWAALSPEDQQRLKPHLLQPGRAPVGEMAAVTHMKNAAAAAGRAGEAIGNMMRPEQASDFRTHPVTQPLYEGMRMAEETQIKRLSAEQLLIEYLIRDMAPEVSPNMPQPQQTWGVPERGSYADPMSEQQYQQERFNEMQRLRRLPPPTQ